MTDAIFNVTTGIIFRDDAQRDVLLRQLIRDANLIETDSTVIRAKTNQGFTRLCTKIRDLWRASYHDACSRDADLYFSGSFQTFMNRSGIVSQRRRHITNRADQDWIIRNAWRMDVRYHAVGTHIRNDRCHATLIEGRNITQTHTGITIGPEALRSALANMNRSIQRQ